MDPPLDDGELLALLREHTERIDRGRASVPHRQRLLREARRREISYERLREATGMGRSGIDKIVNERG